MYIDTACTWKEAPTAGGATAEQPFIEEKRGLCARDDYSIHECHSFSIGIDPFHDHRTGFFFGTNPNGMRVELFHSPTSTWTSARISMPKWDLRHVLTCGNTSCEPDLVPVLKLWDYANLRCTLAVKFTYLFNL
jgi:hypothetical protein